MDLSKHSLSVFKKSSRTKIFAHHITSTFSFTRQIIRILFYIFQVIIGAFLNPNQVVHRIKYSSFISSCSHAIHKRLLRYFLQSLIWLDKIQTCTAIYNLSYLKNKPQLHLASYSKLSLECIGLVLFASWYLSPIWHSQLFIRQRYHILEC